MKNKLDIRFIITAGFVASLAKILPEMATMSITGNAQLDPSSPMFGFGFMLIFSFFIGSLLQGLGMAAAYQLIFPSIPDKGAGKGISYGIIVWLITGFQQAASVFFPTPLPETLALSQLALIRFLSVAGIFYDLVVRMFQGLIIQYFAEKFMITAVK